MMKHVISFFIAFLCLACIPVWRECTQNTSLIVFAFVTRLSIQVLHTYYISH